MAESSPKRKIYICDCGCECEFISFHLALSIYAIKEDNNVAFEFSENALADGTKWSDVIHYFNKNEFKTYGDFTAEIKNLYEENPNSKPLKHLATQYPYIGINPDYKNLRLSYEYIW